MEVVVVVVFLLVAFTDGWCVFVTRQVITLTVTALEPSSLCSHFTAITTATTFSCYLAGLLVWNCPSFDQIPRKNL